MRHLSPQQRSGDELGSIHPSNLGGNDTLPAVTFEQTYRVRIAGRPISTIDLFGSLVRHLSRRVRDT